MYPSFSYFYPLKWIDMAKKKGAMLHVEATKNLASDGAGAPLAESRNAMAKV